jgi:hypothetical protein
MVGADLTGQVFGKLTAIRSVRKPAKRGGTRCFWVCTCECGREVRTTSTNLHSGKSSGCASCNNGYKKRPFEGLYNSLVGSCKRRGYEIDLTYEEYVAFTDERNCHYCGEGLNWIPNGNARAGYKLDRKDNSLGYTKDNCVVCCPRCNWAKQDHFTYDEWKQLGDVIRTWKKVVDEYERK